MKCEKYGYDFIRKEETFEDILHNQIILDFDKVLHQESAKA